MNRINPALFCAAFTAWVRASWPERPEFVAIMSPRPASKPNRPAKRFADTGPSRTGCTGCWTSHSRKTNPAYETLWRKEHGRRQALRSEPRPLNEEQAVHQATPKGRRLDLGLPPANAHRAQRAPELHDIGPAPDDGLEPTSPTLPDRPPALVSAEINAPRAYVEASRAPSTPCAYAADWRRLVHSH